MKSLKLALILTLGYSLLSLNSCKKEDDDSLNFTIEGLALDYFPEGPEGSDTWDNFQTDGPDVFLKIKRGDVNLVETNILSDLSNNGYAEFTDDLPHFLRRNGDLHTLYVIDLDSNDPNDTLAVMTFLPSNYENQNQFSLIENGTKVDFTGSW